MGEGMDDGRSGEKARSRGSLPELDSFHTQEIIGVGSSAIVYRAVHVSLGGEFAVKRWRAALSADQRRKFHDECSIQYQLSGHPNIVQLHWADAPPGEAPWIATELYETTLADRLTAAGPLPIPEALKVAYQILAGLAGIHKHGILHRDVKPANVFLKSDRAALGDLGIAMQIDEWTSDSSAGTNEYVAPELYRGEPPSVRSDIFSAAVTIRRIFADIPQPVADVLDRASSDNPQDRPASALDFTAALTRAAALAGPDPIDTTAPPTKATGTVPGEAHRARAAQVSVPGPPTATDDDWVLAIDFGSSTTIAAVGRIGRSPELVDVAGVTRVPSSVFVDGEDVVAGVAAEHLGRSAPGRLLRSVKARIGDPSAPVLGGRAYSMTRLVGELLHHVYGEAVAQVGSPPSLVVLTHPASWNRPQIKALLDAANTAGLRHVRAVPEPLAAAYGARPAMSGKGGRMVVYDLGGGTFDVAVVAQSREAVHVLGRPDGDGGIGGDLFDDLLVNHIGSNLDPAVWQKLQAPPDDEWTAAANVMRIEVRQAKEALSQHPQADALLSTPQGMSRQRITRSEFEDLIKPYLEETTEVVRRCLVTAQTPLRDVQAIYLVGGASRSPIVARVLEEAFHPVPVLRRGDPKATIVLGALVVADQDQSTNGTGKPSVEVGGHRASPPVPSRALPEPLPDTGLMQLPQPVRAPLTPGDHNTVRRPVPQQFTPPSRDPQPKRDNRWLIAAVAVCLLGISGLVWFTRAGATSEQATQSLVKPQQPVVAVEPMTFPRRDAAAAVTDEGAFWVAGGINDSGELSRSLEAYDVGINTWTTLADLPEPVSAAAMVFIDKDILLMGGFLSSGDPNKGTPTDHVWRWHTGTWVKEKPLTKPRAKASAVVVKGKVLITGGQTGAAGAPQPLTTTEVYDPTGWKTIPSATLPTGLVDMAAASNGNVAYFAGGHPLGSDQPAASVYVLDATSMTYAKPLTIPQPRLGLGAAMVGNTLVLTGGRGGGDSPPTQAYSLAGATWSSLPALLTQRSGAAVASIGSHVFVAGGVDSSGKALASTESLTVSPAAMVTQGWVKGTDLDVASQQAPAVIWPGHGSFCVAGGQKAGDAKAGGYADANAVQCFDKASNTWSVAAPMPQPLDHAMAVYYQGALWVFGGFRGDTGRPATDPTASIWRYNEKTKHWDPQGNLPEARAAGGAVVIGDSIVVVGGRNVNGNVSALVSTTQIFTKGKWHQGQPIPTPRDHLGVVTDGQYLYAIGGRQLKPEKNQNALERYDPATDNWSRLQPMVKGRSGVAATMAGQLIVVAGGEEPSSTDTNVDAYDISLNSWAPLPSLPQGRHGAAMGLAGDHLVLAGGASHYNHQSTWARVDLLKLPGNWPGLTP